MHALATYSDGLGKVACEKSLCKVKKPSALPSKIVMLCGRTKHSDIFEISDRLVLNVECDTNVSIDMGHKSSQYFLPSCERSFYTNVPRKHFQEFVLL